MANQAEEPLLRAPEFSVNQWIDAKGIKTNPIKLSDYKGNLKLFTVSKAGVQAVIAKVFPDLKKMIDALYGNDNVTFFAIQTVFEGYEDNTVEKIIEIQKRYDLKIPFGHDAGDNDKSRSNIMTNYKTGGTPWFIFIDKHDNVVYSDFHLNPIAAIDFFKDFKLNDNRLNFMALKGAIKLNTIKLFKQKGLEYSFLDVEANANFEKELRHLYENKRLNFPTITIGDKKLRNPTDKDLTKWLTKIKIALGGGCHWCTEAVFQALKGVAKVEQGFVASIDKNSSFSEAVIVHFNPEVISLQTLIEIHLHTHNSTSNHSMREKYRSAIYTFSEVQKKESEMVLNSFQQQFENNLITKVYPFSEFKQSREAIQNYYLKNPEKPFCERFINPKLKRLQDRFSQQVNPKYFIVN